MPNFEITKVLKCLNQCFSWLRSPAKQLLIQQVGFVNSRHFFQHRSCAKYWFKNLKVLEKWIETAKGQNIFWNRIYVLFYLVSIRSDTLEQLKPYLSTNLSLPMKLYTRHLNISTTPLWQWGFRQCLPFSWTTLS